MTQPVRSPRWKLAAAAAVVLAVVGGAVALLVSRSSDAADAGHSLTVRVSGPSSTTYAVTVPGLVNVPPTDLPIGGYSATFTTSTSLERLGLFVRGTVFGSQGDGPAPECEVTFDGRQVAHDQAPAGATGVRNFECRVGN
ncbi:hypothetical protein [Amycolatopsis tolypomycina]|uniref:hypothetical protein n=1 Tax=Amycolatopsis tolypomycina TaxID=208445 RepID=UPI0033A35048